jgi:hypothetical protein
MSRNTEDPHVKALDELAGLHASGRIGDIEYELELDQLTKAKERLDRRVNTWVVAGIVVIILFIGGCSARMGGASNERRSIGLHVSGHYEARIPFHQRGVNPSPRQGATLKLSVASEARSTAAPTSSPIFPDRGLRPG